MKESKDVLNNQIKWFIGIFGVMIISSIWHVAVISKTASANESKIESKVDALVFHTMIEGINKRADSESAFYMQALKEQRDFNKELLKVTTSLETMVENMKTCEE